LFTNLFYSFGVRAYVSHEFIFKQFAQSFSGIITIKPLVSALLNFYRQAGGDMFQMNAGGAFIYFLAALTAASNECFLQIYFEQIAFLHTLFDLLFFSFCNSKVNHKLSAFPSHGRRTKAEK
jgi:hypothetical protein